MSDKMIESVSKYSKSTYDALQSLYEMNCNLVEQCIEQHYALANLGVEYTTGQLKLAANARGFKEVITGQSDILNSFNNKLQGISRNSLDIFVESNEEVSTWVEKNMKEAEKGMKDVAKVVPISKAA